MLLLGCAQLTLHKDGVGFFCGPLCGVVQGNLGFSVVVVQGNLDGIAGGEIKRLQSPSCGFIPNKSRGCVGIG